MNAWRCAGPRDPASLASDPGHSSEWNCDPKRRRSGCAGVAAQRIARGFDQAANFAKFAAMLQPMLDVMCGRQRASVDEEGDNGRSDDAAPWG